MIFRFLCYEHIVCIVEGMIDEPALHYKYSELVFTQLCITIDE